MLNQLRHGFSNTINPMFASGTEVETTEHFFLCCQGLEFFENPEKSESNF